MPSTVGTKMQAYCAKCKADAEHTVLEADDKGKKIGNVRCGKCNDEHAFRRPKAGAKPKSKSKSDKPVRSRRTKSPELIASEEWAEVDAMVAAAQKTPYVMDKPFDKGQVLDHSVFGPGLVLAVLGPRKIEVLFRLGRRKLVCGAAS